MPPLSRDRIVATARDLADREGLDAVTLRRLAAELDVHVTSLYNHVATRDAIVDGIVELLISEANLPGRPRNWEEWVRGFVVRRRRTCCRSSGSVRCARAPTGAGRACAFVVRGRARHVRARGPVHGRRLQRDQGDDPCSPRHRRRTRPRRSRRHVGDRRSTRCPPTAFRTSAHWRMSTTPRRPGRSASRPSSRACTRR